MGELAELQQDGTQARLMRHVSSVNIACGAHAGDEPLMDATMREAMLAGVAIGAHPGYPDREHFGRIRIPMDSGELTACIVSQLESFSRVADACGAKIMHVKPHGALYNVAASDKCVARAITRAVRQWGRDVAMTGLAGSGMLEVFADSGFSCLSEAFADRRYESDGTLRSRKLPDAMITDPDEAAEQVIGIVRDGIVRAADGSRVSLQADTICIHSDTHGSAETAARIHVVLIRHGVELRAAQRIQLP